MWPAIADGLDVCLARTHVTTDWANASVRYWHLREGGSPPPRSSGRFWLKPEGGGTLSESPSHHQSPHLTPRTSCRVYVYLNKHEVAVAAEVGSG